MAETFTDKMSEHLAAPSLRVRLGVNAVAELESKSDDLNASAKARLIAEAKAACGIVGCATCKNFKGNKQPS